MIILKQIEFPQVFFKHRLESLTKGGTFFILINELGKRLSNNVYTYYSFSGRNNNESENLVLLNKCIEQRFSQHIIDTCKESHKRDYLYGRNKFEQDWHLVHVPCIIDKHTGNEIIIAEEYSYVNIYDNIIKISKNSNATLYNKSGEILYEGDTSSIHVNKNYVITTPYSWKDEDHFLVFSRKEGKKIAEY